MYVPFLLVFLLNHFWDISEKIKLTTAVGYTFGKDFECDAMKKKVIEDKTEKTFKELYLAGEIGFDEIDRYISHWNNSDDERTLAVYLGLNADEEDVWIDESDEALQEMLDKQKA